MAFSAGTGSRENTWPALPDTIFFPGTRGIGRQIVAIVIDDVLVWPPSRFELAQALVLGFRAAEA